ncbi:MAG: nitroreductase [Rhizobium sp.]|nr:nitroreductase [Rhizobium sp.]
MTDERKPAHPVNPIFLERWSARSFTGESMPEGDLLTMFEAARWAHSAANRQPWRFSYALRGEANFQQYLAFLDEGNQQWGHKAAAIVIVISAKFTTPTDGSEPRPIGTHSLEAGCALQSFTLQAAMMGYIAHPMAGIEKDRIVAELGIAPERYKVEAGIAIGKLADKELLPEKFREREKKSGRRPLEETAFKGMFRG